MTDGHTYPNKPLIEDYARGGAGLVLTAVPLLLVEVHWIVAGLLAACVVIFAVFLLRTWQRQRTVIRLDQTGIYAEGPLGSAIRWDALDTLSLRFFSTRRDRGQGWMHLTLRGGGGSLKLESTLDGFEDIVKAATRAAQGNGVEFNTVTVQNLLAIGALDDAGGETLAERWGVDPPGPQGPKGSSGPSHPGRAENARD